MSDKVLEDQNGDEATSTWGGLPVQEMLDEGFSLKQRRKGNKSYMALRKGNVERSLGPYTQDKWDLFLKEFPDAQLPPRKRERSIFDLKVVRPKGLGTKYTPNLKVLSWFQELQANGYPLDFTTFANDIIETHFAKCHGLRQIIGQERR